MPASVEVGGQPAVGRALKLQRSEPNPPPLRPTRSVWRRTPAAWSPPKHWCASEAGGRTLAAGGNAVDAAVAAAFALGVCEPAASGLGGQTMALVYLAEQAKTIAVDGSSRAPHRTPPAEPKASERRRGHQATTVPSTPAALGYLHERYGRLPFAQVLQPAIELAEGGYPVSELQHRLTVRELKHLKSGTAAQFFLKEGRRAYAPGDILRQPVLARTLRRLAAAGYEDFYRGEIAESIHNDMQATTA